MAPLIVAGTATAQPIPLSDLPAWAQETNAPKRHALVIGISDYARAPLKTPKHDATIVSKALDEKYDFEVVPPPAQPTFDGILTAVETLAARVNEGDIVIFYFSGHGVQHNQANYLVPLGAGAVGPEQELFDVYVPVSTILQLLNARKPGSVTLILDACRVDPFSLEITAGTYDERFEPVYLPPSADGQSSSVLPTTDLGSRRGLNTKEKAKPSMQIAFAASANEVAYSLVLGDQPEHGSIYTRRLFETIVEKDLLASAFKSTTKQIAGLTDDAQVPQVADGGAYDVPMIVPMTEDAARAETKAWKLAVKRGVQAGNEYEELRRYVESNAASVFAAAARKRMADPALSRSSVTYASDYAKPLNIPDTALWSGNLKSPSINAWQASDIVVTTRQVDIVEPRSVLGFIPVAPPVPLPDRRLTSLAAGSTVRVLEYDRPTRKALVDVGGGRSGYIRNVMLTVPRAGPSAVVAFTQAGADATVIDWGAVGGLLPQMTAPAARVIVRVGLAEADGAGRQRQLSYLRALELREELIARGVNITSIQLETSDSSVESDRARIEIVQGG